MLSVFRKPTLTGLGMNFHSQMYINFKLNNIRTLFYRAFKISSNWQTFHEEIAFLLNFFNNKTRDLVFSICRKFMNKLILDTPPISTAKKMHFYHKIPIISNYSCSFIKNNYEKFLSVCYPQINFKMVFSNSFKIQGLFKHKEKLPAALESGIVYIYI